MQGLCHTGFAGIQSGAADHAHVQPAAAGRSADCDDSGDSPPVAAVSHNDHYGDLQCWRGRAEAAFVVDLRDCERDTEDLAALNCFLGQTDQVS